MSAKQAAKALLKNDVDLAAFVASLPQGPQYGWDGSNGRIFRYIRENVMNTWTLTLVADATGSSERQVIAAVLHEMRIGSTCVCQGYAKMMFDGIDTEAIA